LTGTAAVTINGHTLSVNLTVPFGATLSEDLFDLFATTAGSDAAGNAVNITQLLSCGSSCVPVADLQTSFTYAVQPGDFADDSFEFTGAGTPGSTPTATFDGTPTGFNVLVSEPNSVALLVTGLLGLGVLVRRRRA
jgi:hypothetical protein